jgi:L-fuconolactonase
MLALADANAFIAGVVGWVDLMSSRVDDQLVELTAHPKFKGVRHLVESEPMDDWLAQPEVLRGLNRLSAHKLSYDLLVHTRHLKHVLEVMDRCPELKLVIDHMAKPPIASAEIKTWRRR